MGVLGLSVDELRQAAAACTSAGAPGPAPASVRRFLADRLGAVDRRLARKVGALDDWQLGELLQVISAPWVGRAVAVATA